ncbi:DUF502 domain-containing protein [Halapricum desulfuricans]|uniref:Putative membrane protein n=1 Tax=Halapricum desulfuricans TaxID=2841257 RepID=A0A897NN15_9EURY|nr:DUF502 domain-containing protein [Halapricum desulfuricans]QSG14142.1 putative membrane protein [Halapricum desulfuricans]
MSATWKRDFASGLIVLLPLLVTVFVLTWLYNRIKQVPLQGVVSYEPLQVLLTIVVFVLVVFAIGYLMRTAIGSLLEAGIDSLMNRLPGLRVIYNASKMAVETAVGGTEELQAPVKIETWNGMRMTAFKTGQVASDGRELLFLPTAPNITTGFVVEVEPDEYEELDESVEDALTRVLSAGFGESNDQEVSLDILVEKADDGRPE